MQDARELATREGILIICIRNIIVVRINMGSYQITMILLRFITYFYYIIIIYYFDMY